jgi:hypothetical protein
MRVSWKNVREFAEFLSYLSVVIAILIAIAEYYSSVYQSRLNRSMEFLTQFRSPDVRLDRAKIENPWKHYDIQRLNALSGNAGAIGELAKQIVTSDERALESLINIVELFDSMGTCVERNICDSPMIKSQLGQYAQSLNCLYGDTISDYKNRMLLSELGKGITTIQSAEGC